MDHEVYICFDEKDKLAAEAICHVFEENKFKCWMKSRDLGKNHYAEYISRAIKASKVVVLVYSDTARNSNFVTSEIDMAFSNNIPILVFRIDQSTSEGELEFFLHNQHWLDAYPNPKIQFASLVRDASNLLGKPIRSPVINNNLLKNISITDNSAKKKQKENLHWKKIASILFFVPLLLLMCFFILGKILPTIYPSFSDYYFLTMEGTCLIFLTIAFWIVDGFYIVYNLFFK